MSSTVRVETSAGIVELPQLSTIRAGVLRKARKATDEMDQFFTILESVLGEESLELHTLDQLPLEELAQVFEQWTGTTPGEFSNLPA
jgi:hypothetical protein